MTAGDARDDDPRRVHPVVERLGGYGWRLLVLAAVVLGCVWLLRELWVLVLASVAAVFLARALDVPVNWLRSRGAPPALAAVGALLVFFVIVGLAGWFVVPRVADEFESLGPTLSEALDDVETWLVDDAPFDVSRTDLERFRSDAGEILSDRLRSSSGTIVSGALLAVEILTGLILALITTFFLLKDGPRFQTWVLRRLPSPRREPARRMAARAWTTIGGYLKGAALLGVIEGVIIGVTMTVVGASLAIPVALLTFAAAFVPIAGAIVAGVVAALVALATAGFGGAAVVAIVALVVQQLDNDLLAPVIYGRALQLPPLLVLFVIVGGAALFGFAGSVLAVPLTAVVVNVSAEAGLGAPRDDDDGDRVDGHPP